MKITRETLKNIIKEEAEKNTKEEKPNRKGLEEPYTPYEQQDLSSDEKMVFLLEEILSQLKVLNMTMTKAKSFGASSLEKALAARAVAESGEK